MCGMGSAQPGCMARADPPWCRMAGGNRGSRWWRGLGPPEPWFVFGACRHGMAPGAPRPRAIGGSSTAALVCPGGFVETREPRGPGCAAVAAAAGADCGQPLQSQWQRSIAGAAWALSGNPEDLGCCHRSAVSLHLQFGFRGVVGAHWSGVLASCAPRIFSAQAGAHCISCGGALPDVTSFRECRGRCRSQHCPLHIPQMRLPVAALLQHAARTSAPRRAAADPAARVIPAGPVGTRRVQALPNM